VANREHKAYPNIRETPFYSPGVGLARFHEWKVNRPDPLIATVIATSRLTCADSRFMPSLP